jgi:membrane-associated protease RseP (regulator of RpoE activity)
MRTIGSGVFLALWCLAASADGAAPVAFQDARDAKEEKSFEIPYKFTAAKHIVVRAKINGKGPFNFVLDTGAPALFVAVPVGKKAKVKADGDGWADLDRFEIEGGLVIKGARARIETPFQLEGMNGMGMAGMEIHGLLGYNLLAKYRMTFDFTKDKLVFTELDFKPEQPFKLKGKTGGQGGLEGIGQVMKLLGSIMGRKATPETTLRGFFGMTLADGEENPKVESVLDRGPAGEAGLKKGDIVTHVNGRSVTNVEDVVRQAAKTPGKAEVKLTIQRGGEKKSITFKTGEGI